MKCEQGDIATIIHAIRDSNIGKTVLVETYIGYFQAGDEFNFNGLVCEAHSTDHHWWVAADYGLHGLHGNSPKLYIPDSWLEPIRPTLGVTHTENELDLVL
jgi:hypothetical protein